MLGPRPTWCSSWSTSSAAHGRRCTHMEVRPSISCSKGKSRCGMAGWIVGTRLGSRGPTVPAKFTRQAILDLAKPGCSRIFYCRRAPQITVVEESQLGPAVTYESKFPLPSLATETEIVQQVIDLPPGWRTERAYHGFAAGLIMEGEVAHRIGPDRKSYKHGDNAMGEAGN